MVIDCRIPAKSHVFLVPPIRAENLLRLTSLEILREELSKALFLFSSGCLYSLSPLPNTGVQRLTYVDDYGTKWPSPNLVREETHNGKTIYFCNCGLGYDDILVAYACEEYARTHGISSEEIIKRAVYNPRSVPQLAKRNVMTP